MNRAAKPTPAQVASESSPAFRSATVAQMAQMPVATLRIWEQRYRAVKPLTSASGRRLYSPADVQRVILLRRLTERGHAIGEIAALESSQLQQLSVGSAVAGPEPVRRSKQSDAPLRLAVVGYGLAARLDRAVLQRHIEQPIRRVALFDSLSEASSSTPKSSVDWLIWHAPELSDEIPSELKEAQKACKAKQLVVVYRYAGSAAIKALSHQGATLIREPADDKTLGTLLASVPTGSSKREASPRGADLSREFQPHPKLRPSRFDESTLTAIAGLPSSVACECPRHVAELLLQISSFEAYSARCINRTQADAELHAYLEQVAGASRMLFEAALERVARHEDLGHLRLI